jgi:membrane protease YdiL (CAAX protease family)
VTLAADLGLLAWVMWRLRKDGRNLADIGLTADWLGREAFIGLLIGCGLWVIAQMPVWLLQWLKINIPAAVLPSVGTPVQWLYVIVIALCEEIVWRGYVLTELHRLYRLSISVVMAVAAFAVFHLGEAMVLDWFVLPTSLYVGGWLSVLYLWRRSLIAPIVAHLVMSGLGLVGARPW